MIDGVYKCKVMSYIHHAHRVYNFGIPYAKRDAISKNKIPKPDYEQNMASVNLFSSESEICSAATTTPPSVCIVGETLIRF